MKWHKVIFKMGGQMFAAKVPSGRVTPSLSRPQPSGLVFRGSGRWRMGGLPSCRPEPVAQRRRELKRRGA